MKICRRQPCRFKSDQSHQIAELAYWLCPSLPSWSKEFDSPTLLHSEIIMFDNLRTTPEVQQERMNVCATCEHNKLNVCRKCGCILKLKTQWANTKCPVGKWGPVTKSSQSSGIRHLPSKQKNAGSSPAEGAIFYDTKEI